MYCIKDWQFVIRKIPTQITNDSPIFKKWFGILKSFGDMCIQRFRYSIIKKEITAFQEVYNKLEVVAERNTLNSVMTDEVRNLRDTILELYSDLSLIIGCERGWIGLGYLENREMDYEYWPDDELPLINLRENVELIWINSIKQIDARITDSYSIAVNEYCPELRTNPNYDYFSLKFNTGPFFDNWINAVNTCCVSWYYTRGLFLLQKLLHLLTTKNPDLDTYNKAFELQNTLKSELKLVHDSSDVSKYTTLFESEPTILKSRIGTVRISVIDLKKVK